MAPRAVIFGCAGPRLTPEERAFFAETNPLGFIVFARNVEDPRQLRDLTNSLRECVSRADAPVLVDQEGGRVARLQPPYWREAPAAETFGRLYRQDRDAATEAARLNALLMAMELQESGIDVDCAPVLDLRLPEGHEVIGDRAFSDDVDVVVALARAMAEGLMAGGIMPVGKHVPGHGRAPVDSHLELPRVEASHATLSETDFQCFKALSDLPWMMTGHVIYADLDADRPATTSRRILEEIVRDEIGFEGVLISDDLSMRALSGGFERRAADALAAGCDLVLHCNGDMREMREVAKGTAPLTDISQRRVTAARQRLEAAQQLSAKGGLQVTRGMEARLDALLRAA